MAGPKVNRSLGQAIATGGNGSFTPIQLTNTRTFDQLFTWPASQAFQWPLVEDRAVWANASVERLGHAENSLHHADADPQSRDSLHFAGPLRSELEDALLDLRGHVGSTKGHFSRLRPGKTGRHRMMDHRHTEFS